MRLAWVVGIAIALLVLAAIGVVAVNLSYGIDDAYAQWGASDMVIDYLEDHDGQWPPSWEALRPYFDAGGSRVGGWSYAKYQQRVYIDFSADADALRKQAIASDNVPFDVIHANWSFGCMMGDGPNADLHYYFRRKAGIFEAPEPDEGWQFPEHKKLADQWYGRGFNTHFDEKHDLVSAWTSFSGPRNARDEDLPHFKQHPQLRALNLVGSDEITDSGLAVIKSLRQLKSLDLSGDRITDACLDQLSGHPSLAELDIFGTAITDAGFLRLHELPALKSIRFDPERIQPETVQQLKTAMPELVIEDVMVLEAGYE